MECQIPLTPPFLKGDLAGFLYEVMRDTIITPPFRVRRGIWAEDKSGLTSPVKRYPVRLTPAVLT